MKTFLLKFFGPHNVLVLYLKYKDLKKKISDVIKAIKNLIG